MYTGFTSDASTTANVFIQLSGDEGQTPVRNLKDENRKIFQKRSQDVFLASFPDDIGDLNYLRIWHDNTGLLEKSPQWSYIEHSLKLQNLKLCSNKSPSQ